MEENISLQDYKKQLESFDWFYGMSEDNQVYRIGQHKYNNLIELSNQSKAHRNMFDNVKAEKYKQILE